MDFTELAKYRRSIEKEIERQYAAQRRRATPSVRPYLDILEEFTLRGGKRFRAICLLAGYHIATGRDPKAVVAAAAAMEHFQSWMLIHDDIIDHGEERRGGPTVHRRLALEHAQAMAEGSAEDYGTGIGITVGDLEEPFTVDALLSTPAPAACRLAALAEYVEMTRLTAYGQLLDVRNGTRDPSLVTEKDVLLVHELKSAIYTVVSPLRIGARLGGVPARCLEDLSAIGTDLGIAFQLRDDVLGAGFDAEASGKSSNDIVEGKRTLLIVRAWNATDDAGRDRLRRVLGNPHAATEDVERARELIRTTGSLEYSEAQIARLARRAYARLARSRTIRPAGKPLLKEIGERLVQRST
ncbi:MAG: polyprenyl synthetase family protein [Thermoplasmata archaeon]